MTTNSYPRFSASSSAAILALTALQTGRGVDPRAAVDRAMHTWWQRIVAVGHDSYDADELAALARTLSERSGPDSSNSDGRDPSP